MPYRCPDLAVILPVRIDHPDRASNFDTVLRYFAKFFSEYEMILVESGAAPRLTHLANQSGVVHCFIAGEGPLYKTKMLNIGARLTERPLAVFYDTDVLFRPEAVQAVLMGLRNNPALAFGIPYNGIQLNVGGADKAAISEEFDFGRFPGLKQAELYKDYGNSAVCWNPEGVGGATFFKRAVYLDCGGYNEKLVGCYWEDYEIVARFSLMGYPPFAISDANLYHLEHERTNPGNRDPLWHINEAEYNRVLAMPSEEIRRYIQEELLCCEGLSGPLPPITFRDAARVD